MPKPNAPSLYTQSRCADSAKVRAWLTACGVTVTERPVTDQETAAALARHDALRRRAIEPHGAAAEPWNEAGPLRVRMAPHPGQTVPHRADIRLVTFNVLADFLHAEGVPAWEERRAPCVQALRAAEPDIIGLQEAMPTQIRFLRARLPEFTAVTVEEAMTNAVLRRALRQHYGVAIATGTKRPHEVVLFFRAAAFALLDGGRWWLSPTPDVPSVGFGNIAPRFLLWLKLRHVASGSVVLMATTHLDWRSTLPMMEICRQKLDALAAGAGPAFFMGDFNVTAESPEYALMMDAGWRDANMGSDDRAKRTPGGAPRRTPEPRSRPAMPPDLRVSRVDHILYRGEGVIPREWRRLASPVPGRLLSDHDPIWARLRVG